MILNDTVDCVQPSMTGEEDLLHLHHIVAQLLPCCDRHASMRVHIRNVGIM